MKQIILIFSFLFAVSVNNMSGQQIGVNVDSQPAWGPVGYNYAEFYYFPDINAYYIVTNHRFVFQDGNQWVIGKYLPYLYRNYDLYSMYKVVLSKEGREPWKHNKKHRKKFNQYRGVRNQSVIINSNDEKYDKSKKNRILWYRGSTSKT